MQKGWGMWIVGVIAILAAAGIAQEPDSSSSYFDCPYINYFEDGCPQTEEERLRASESGEESEKPQEDVEEREGDLDWMEDVPEELLPLFPRESLSSDTPPLYHLLLMKPTLENARRYSRWHTRRMKRIQEVQGLLKAVGQEALTERVAKE